MKLSRTIHVPGAGYSLFESARYSAETSSFSWVDIEQAVLFGMSPNGDVTVNEMDQDFLPLALPLASSEFLLASGSALHIFDLKVRTSSVWLEMDNFDNGTRFNDGAFDLFGILWIGTMRLSEESECGVLYRIQPDKSASIEYRGVGISNGIHWVDQKNGYYVDSASKKLMRIVQNSSGFLQSVQQIAEWEEGEPDGIAVTSTGEVWVAVWDGKRIDRFSSRGEALGCIPTSGTRPTSISFGSGRASQSMIITFAAEPGTKSEAAKVELFSGPDVPLPHQSYNLTPTVWPGNLLDQACQTKGDHERA
ncbi:SMP-30/gluconolactonase/LRE family protein [Rhodococcus sp. 06-1460-1B]|uniref:SMP-30/gluconolactonase/LRE family protein n=1 Tax=Rhodococcus sp. 06-1460-1B TaxID=2022501 RepID=UPI001595B0D0|nr:SMP-30/gluconolactonase/LRE family protein [Rhodococcus sp. 06-1460-1B]